MRVNLRLDAHRLSPEKESVLALFGAGADVRLVYGELVQGVYRMLWDAPLLGSGASVRYQDVDGDGIQEIVAQWLELGGSVVFQALSVFNSKGEKLTRQGDCFPKPHAELAQFTCPIYGAEVELRRTASGKYDVAVVPADQSGPQDSERYVLVNGHYKRIEKLNGPATKKR